MICSTCNGNRWRLSSATIDTDDGPAFERTCSLCGAPGPYVLARPNEAPKTVPYGAVENAALAQNIVYPDVAPSARQRHVNGEPAGIDCLACGGKTRVVDSRFRGDGSIRRRRTCLNCGHRHTTYEMSNDAWEAITRQQKALVIEMQEHAAAIVRLAAQFNAFASLDRLDMSLVGHTEPDRPALPAPAEDVEEAEWSVA